MKDSPFQDVLKYGMYERNHGDFIESVCNLCGLTFELPCDVLEHIISEHMDDTLPDVDPAA